MNTVMQIIEQNGGLEKLKSRALKIKNEGFMDLVIEHIGKGPLGHDAISVCHYYIQNGDMMRDPEVCFQLIEEVTIKKIKGISKIQKELKMIPYLFVQDGGRPRYDEVYLLNEDGSVHEVSLKLQYSIQGFCNFWSKNLKSQGFLDTNNTKVEEIE
ncbi:DUF6908 domain-containing protein [Leptospira santarosai]|uniref:DUF6908 domain-containing protein n=2 Tax=Leptospira santarosai TaxID=28183 RepID=A0A0M2X0Q6_9LEPT|nr:hypothetical protein [Leptospira santarosai]OLY59347.1 hypothetical protein BV917_15215 [Leptospira santarosai serovar Guaricura]ONF77688.1 hypothetical protein BWD12_15045 [Leptospira santarosai serovar Bananal]AVQ11263.1 Uncharacterized protein XB16_0928 [Leptospira santarosai]AVV51443.1 Uncharacterized protein XB17_02866 [Leptospira santarosai]AVV79187.1 Uncharacterized protein XB15_01409 [Leptospira santarosai]